jgi:hypothetical protein
MTFEFESVDEYLQVVTDVTVWRRRMDGRCADDLSGLKAALAEDGPATHAERPRASPGHGTRRVRE